MLLHPGGPLGRTEWIVPRASLLYRRFDFSALPVRRRVAAARIAMARDAQPGVLLRTAWVRGVAHVWSWSPPADAPARERAGWVPESLVRPRPLADGARLMALVDGVEGQIWRDGDLVASQWWSAPPTEQAWHRFLRSAGLSPPAAGTVPTPQATGWASPWARIRGAAAGSERAEAVVWRLAIAGIALTLGWQLMAREDERDAHAALLARTEALRQRATPLLEARERADTAQAEIERLRALQRASSDYALMPAVTIPLGAEARLVGWQRQGDVLKAKVAVKDVDPRRAVEAYARIGLLADVQAIPMPPEAMGLEFKLPAAFRAAGAEEAVERGREAGAQE